MLPTMSKVGAKAAQLAHNVTTAAKSVPRVVSHIVDSAENIVPPAQSWANTNTNSDAIKAMEERAHSRLGSVADHAMCARSSEEILLGKSGLFPDATTWERSVPKNEWHPWKAGDEIPAGTAVFYQSSNPHGHVAVSMGGGKVYTTDAFGNKSGIVDADKVFGDRTPIGWTDWAKGDIGTDQNKEIIGLDNRASVSPSSRSSSETGAARQESFTTGLSSVGGDYASNPLTVGATPTQPAKRGVLGLDVDTSS